MGRGRRVEAGPGYSSVTELRQERYKEICMSLYSRGTKRGGERAFCGLAGSVRTRSPFLRCLESLGGGASVRERRRPGARRDGFRRIAASLSCQLIRIRMGNPHRAHHYGHIRFHPESTTMFCPECGRELPAGAYLCPSCGHVTGASGTHDSGAPNPPMLPHLHRRAPSLVRRRLSLRRRRCPVARGRVFGIAFAR